MAPVFGYFRFLLLLYFWISFVDRCHGSCFQGPIMTEITEFGRRRMYCEYQSAGSKLQLLPGSSFYTADCHECSCTISGLQCCGFGYKAGKFSMSGCVMKTDGCQPVFVRTDNHTLDCFSGEPVDFSSSPQLTHPDNQFSLERSGKLPKSTSVRQSQVTKPQTVSLRDILLQLDGTKLAPSRPMQSQMQEILSGLWSRSMQPHLQQVSMARQVPVDTSSQQSMTFTTDTTSQDVGWLPWMFFLN